MRKTRQETKITRDKLRKSALILFLKHGYSRVSLEQIAKNSGLTRGAFYWHFSSKEEILSSLLDDYHRNMEELLTRLFKIEESDHLKKLKIILDQIIDHFYNNSGFRKFIKLRWFKLEQDLSAPSVMVSSIANDYFIIELEKLITKGQQNCTIRLGFSAEELAIHAASLISGIYRLFFITSYLRKVSHAKRTIELFCKSLEV